MKELKIINTTPHDIVFMNDNQEIVRTFPKSDSPLRLKEKQEYQDSVRARNARKPLHQVEAPKKLKGCSGCTDASGLRSDYKSTSDGSLRRKTGAR